MPSILDTLKEGAAKFGKMAMDNLPGTGPSTKKKPVPKPAAEATPAPGALDKGKAAIEGSDDRAKALKELRDF